MSPLKRLFAAFRSRKQAEGAGEAQETAPVAWVVAGLGNPGEKYRRSRHNAGFAVVERLAASAGARFSRRRFNGITARIELAGAPAILVKPETYYNASGECIAALLGYFKVPAGRLIVVHDDLDLEAGRLRIKQGGSDAGNRGVRSVSEMLGTPDFIRVRIGIGRPAPGGDAKEYVLEPMTKEIELSWFVPAIERAAEAVKAIAEEGLERAMGRFNQRV
ncbi:MAG TPA: aminoacyl-tRNA hydrolase [Candidatus Binataceae bacterium]|nr:aminoacyl-tRNA hydrolase [Candidatus Binataceae bacterium]